MEGKEKGIIVCVLPACFENHSFFSSRLAIHEIVRFVHVVVLVVVVVVRIIIIIIKTKV